MQKTSSFNNKTTKLLNNHDLKEDKSIKKNNTLSSNKNIQTISNVTTVANADNTPRTNKKEKLQKMFENKKPIVTKVTVRRNINNQALTINNLDRENKVTDRDDVKSTVSSGSKNNLKRDMSASNKKSSTQDGFKIAKKLIDLNERDKSKNAGNIGNIGLKKKTTDETNKENIKNDKDNKTKSQKQVTFEKRPLTSKAKAVLDQKIDKQTKAKNDSNQNMPIITPISTPNNMHIKKISSRNSDKVEKVNPVKKVYEKEAKIIKIDLNPDIEKNEKEKALKHKGLIVEKIDLNSVKNKKNDRAKSEVRSYQQPTRNERIKSAIPPTVDGKKTVREKVEKPDFRPSTATTNIAKKTIPSFQSQKTVNKLNSNTLNLLEPQNSLSTEASVFRGRADDYNIGREIGKGAYAIVRYSIHKPTNKEVAVKIYEKVKLLDIQKKNAVKREIQILKVLNHDNIVKLYEVVDTPKQILIVMELVTGVSLLSFLKSKTNHRMSDKECADVFSQIIRGMDYLHTKNIFHRDIKLENIIVENNSKIKIIDFGFSILVDSTKYLNFFCGTPSYMPPEIVQKKDYNGPPADIWSLGILLYTLLCGCFPFRAQSEMDLYSKIVKGIFPLPDYLSNEAKNLLKSIIIVDPKKRPTTKEY